MDSSNDLSWVDALTKQIANEAPPLNAISHETLTIETKTTSSTLHRKMRILIASGKMDTMLYKGRRFYWPKQREKK